MILDQRVFNLHLSAAESALERAEVYLENYERSGTPLSRLLLNHCVEHARGKIAMAKLYIKEEEE